MPCYHHQKLSIFGFSCERMIWISLATKFLKTAEEHEVLLLFNIFHKYFTNTMSLPKKFLGTTSKFVQTYWRFYDTFSKQKCNYTFVY